MKLTEPLTFAVFGFDRVTVWPLMLVTVAPEANPVPLADAPTAMPVTELRTTVLVPLTPLTLVVVIVVVKVMLEATAAVVGRLNVTVLPETAVTVDFAAIPVPLTADPTLMPVGLVTVRVVVFAAAVAATDTDVVPVIWPVTEPVLRVLSTKVFGRIAVTVAPLATPAPVTCVPMLKPVVELTFTALPVAMPATADDVTVGFW